MHIATPRKTGVSAYGVDGANRGPAAHRLDAAVLFRRAVETAPAGSVLHGVAESGVPVKSVAETIARSLGLPMVSLTPDEPATHFVGLFMATAYGFDGSGISGRRAPVIVRLPPSPWFGPHCGGQPPIHAASAGRETTTWAQPARTV